MKNYQQINDGLAQIDEGLVQLDAGIIAMEGLMAPIRAAIRSAQGLVDAANYRVQLAEAALEEAKSELKRRVDEKTYQAFELYVLQGRSAAKVAEVLAISTNQLYAVKHRCMNIIQKNLFHIAMKKKFLNSLWIISQECLINMQ